MTPLLCRYRESRLRCQLLIVTWWLTFDISTVNNLPTSSLVLKYFHFQKRCHFTQRNCFWPVPFFTQMQFHLNILIIKALWKVSPKEAKFCSIICQFWSLRKKRNQHIFSQDGAKEHMSKRIMQLESILGKKFSPSLVTAHVGHRVAISALCAEGHAADAVAGEDGEEGDHWHQGEGHQGGRGCGRECFRPASLRFFFVNFLIPFSFLICCSVIPGFLCFHQPLLLDRGGIPDCLLRGQNDLLSRHSGRLQTLHPCSAKNLPLSSCLNSLNILGLNISGGILLGLCCFCSILWNLIAFNQDGWLGGLFTLLSSVSVVEDVVGQIVLVVLVVVVLVLITIFWRLTLCLSCCEMTILNQLNHEIQTF